MNLYKNRRQSAVSSCLFLFGTKQPNDFIFNSEVSELQKKNLSLRQRNRLLNSKNEELLRQVESLEEENEKQRNKEMEMEKELKKYLKIFSVVDYV